MDCLKARQDGQPSDPERRGGLDWHAQLEAIAEDQGEEKGRSKLNAGTQRRGDFTTELAEGSRGRGGLGGKTQRLRSFAQERRGLRMTGRSRRRARKLHSEIPIVRDLAVY